MAIEVTRAGGREPVYFAGVWSSGHFLHREGGRSVQEHEVLPEVFRRWDGVLQPGCVRGRDDRYESRDPQIEGQVRMHYAAGWTAFSFWDRSADTRGGCNANFFAHGRYSFDEMKQLAAERFPSVWNRFKYPIVLVETVDHEPKPRPVLLFCPHCQAPHVDEGEWATKPHHKHLCAACGQTFRVEPYCYGLPHPAPDEEVVRLRAIVAQVRAAVAEAKP